MTPNPSFHRTLRDEAAQRPVNSNVKHPLLADSGPFERSQRSIGVLKYILSSPSAMEKQKPP